VTAIFIFLALGLGLALPFLLIGYMPALASRLPKPGAWMETFKQVLAFPMYLTAVWLVWVLGKQRGVDAVGTWVLAGAVVLALGLWWWERRRFKEGFVSRALAVLVILASLAPVWVVSRMAPMATLAHDESALAYSKPRLAELREAGRTVFVNMTADWCVTCKANEKAVLAYRPFQRSAATVQCRLHGRRLHRCRSGDHRLSCNGQGASACRCTWCTRRTVAKAGSCR
jgi:thiol:disulfide interchange protein